MGVRFLPDRSPFLGSWSSGGAAPWTPASLGASLLAWWDAERADLMTNDGGGLISSWRDVVGAYNVTAATTARPTYSATSFNGRPGVTFDGIANTLTLAGVPVGIPTGAVASELWGAFDQTALAADATARHAFNIGSGAGSTARAIGRSSVTSVNRAHGVAGNGTNIVVTNSSTDFSGRHVVRIIVDGTNAFCEIDGNLSAGTATVPTTATNRIRIGAASATSASNWWQGGISTVLVTAILTAPQATQLRAWLTARVT